MWLLCLILTHKVHRYSVSLADVLRFANFILPQYVGWVQLVTFGHKNDMVKFRKRSMTFCYYQAENLVGFIQEMTLLHRRQSPISWVKVICDGNLMSQEIRSQWTEDQFSGSINCNLMH